MKILALAALPVLAGCPLLELETEVGEVCVTYAAIQIDGVVGDHVQHSFTADDLGQLQSLVEQDAELSFTRVEIRGAVGAVTRASVSVASGDPESTLPTMSIVACDGDCFATSGALAIPAATQRSAVEYVKSGSLVVDLDLAGQLPSEAWTADVDVCMSGRFRYAIEP